MLTNFEQVISYKKILESIKEDLLNYDWDSLPNLEVNMMAGSSNKGNLSYNFLKMSPKNAIKKIETTNNELINNFLLDCNILSVGRILMAPDTEISLHKDSEYWSQKFFRFHIPKNESKAIFRYGEKEIRWKKDEIYVFDVMNVVHGAFTDSCETEIIYVDITQEKQNCEEDKYEIMNTKFLEMNKIFPGYKNFYSPRDSEVKKSVQNFSWKSVRNDK